MIKLRTEINEVETKQKNKQKKSYKESTKPGVGSLRKSVK